MANRKLSNLLLLEDGDNPLLPTTVRVVTVSIVTNYVFLQQLRYLMKLTASLGDGTLH